jgi:cell fate regulator YaaT (PSP1 superfamily)
MAKIIGVRFRDAGKVYYFDPKDTVYRYNEHVIVETARGIEYGTVIVTPMEIPDERITQPLKEVIRIATPEDDEREINNRRREKDAYKICQEKIREHNLEMKLIAAEYSFDDSKLLFYFTADGRIDFRDLVKDLAGIFRKRIELRQIGVRDETKILGGIGICGRPLCCHSYLSDFAPVSIKMAKEQNLSLNPTKISGTCGRLMCCLKNEAETYEYLNKGLPGKGDQVTTPDGRHGEVQSVNILRQLVKVIVYTNDDEKELIEYPVADITFIPHSRKAKPQMQKGKKGQENGEKKAAEQERKTPEQEKYQQAIKKAIEKQNAVKEEKENAAAGNSAAGAEDGEVKKKRHRRSRHRKKGGQAQGAGDSQNGESQIGQSQSGENQGGGNPGAGGGEDAG